MVNLMSIIIPYIYNNYDKITMDIINISKYNIDELL